MSNQTRIILFQSDKFLNQTISEEAFAAFVEEETGEQIEVSTPPITKLLTTWLPDIVAQLQADEEPPFIEQTVVDFLYEHAAGFYHLAGFESGSTLDIDLETLRPLLPARFHTRIDHDWDDSNTLLPPDATTNLAMLNKIAPGWLFFTRQEIIDIRPIILEVIEDEAIDFYDEEWHQVITAHKRYEYDWLAFHYML